MFRLTRTEAAIKLKRHGWRIVYGVKAMMCYKDGRSVALYPNKQSRGPDGNKFYWGEISVSRDAIEEMCGL